MSRPSDGFELDELRDEFDWTHEFLSRMAERITHDPDVHNLVDSVNKLEAENAKLRELVRDMFDEIEVGGFDPIVERHGKSTVYYEEDPYWRVGIRERVRELGIEVDE